QGRFQGGRRFALALGIPEEIAGGEMAGAQGFLEQFRLCTLADPRRTEQDQPVNPVTRRQDRLALGQLTALEPGPSIAWHVRSPRTGQSWRIATQPNSADDPGRAWLPTEHQRQHGAEIRDPPLAAAVERDLRHVLRG